MIRSTVVISVLLAAGCGRLRFDETRDAGGDSGGFVLPTGQVAYLKASNTDMNDLFGASVALSSDGTVLAVGAYQEASNATGAAGDQSNDSVPGAGAVYVFHRDTGGWTQTEYLKASNPDINDQFGFALALSGDGHTLAVVAPLEASNAVGIDGSQTNNLAAASGAVYVFSDLGGTWAQQAYIKASNTNNNDQFGFALALSGDGNTLAVGGRQEDSAVAGIGADQTNNAAADAGAVYVFTRVGTQWSQQEYIKPSFVRAGVEFGRTVALSGDGNTLVAAATYDVSNAVGIGGDQTNTAAGAAGAAYVFDRNGATWTEGAYIKASNTNGGDTFGWNVSLAGDGNTIAIAAIAERSNATGVGANQLDNSAIDAGAVYVFVRAGATWVQEAYVKAPNTEMNDQFGYATALTRDGNTLVISADGESSAATGIGVPGTDNAALNSGAVYVYARSAGVWSFASFIKASNPETNDGLNSVAVADNGTIACGASREDSAASGIDGDSTSNAASASGAVYVFE